MKNINELDSNTFQNEVLRAELPVVVDFYAPWCGPCKMLAPILAQLAGEFEGHVRFAKLNVDEAPELAAEYNVTGVPTLALFRGGEFVESLVGLVAPGRLKTWLEKAAATPAPASSRRS